MSSLRICAPIDSIKDAETETNFWLYLEKLVNQIGRKQCLFVQPDPITRTRQ